MNGLLEFGSYGTILATAICDFKIGSHEYKENDLVFKLTDVPIQLNYDSNSSNAKARRNEIYYNDCYLDNLVINASPFALGTNYIFDNLFNEEIEILEVEETIPQDGFIVPIYTPVEDTIRISGINNFEIRNADPCILYSEEFVNGQKITLQYKRRVKTLNISLDNSVFDIPYLKLQINFVGNYNKKDMNSYLLVNKTSMQMTPVMNLSQGGVSTINLYFKVINGDEVPRMAVECNG